MTKEHNKICPKCNIPMKLNEAESNKVWSCKECGLQFSKG